VESAPGGSPLHSPNRQGTTKRGRKEEARGGDACRRASLQRGGGQAETRRARPADARGNGVELDCLVEFMIDELTN
jgi:hypothetical protein